MRVRQSLLISTLIIDAAKDWDGKDITNIGTINAVAIAAHQARHDPGGADAMAVDAAVGVGSLRTLGAGAVQAAPGNHTHTLAAEAESGTKTTYAPDSYQEVTFARETVEAMAGGADIDPFITKTDTFSTLSLALAAVVGPFFASAIDSIKIRLWMGGVQVAESEYISGSAFTPTNLMLQGDRALSGSQIVKATVHNYNGGARDFNWFAHSNAATNMFAYLIVGCVKV